MKRLIDWIAESALRAIFTTDTAAQVRAGASIFDFDVLKKSGFGTMSPELKVGEYSLDWPFTSLITAVALQPGCA